MAKIYCILPIQKSYKQTQIQSISLGILTFIWFLIVSQSMVSGEPLVLEKYGQRYTPDPYIDIFEDPSSMIKFNDILKKDIQNKFVRNPKKVANFGYSSSTFWVRLKIKNNILNSPEKFNLQVNFSNFQYIDFFNLYPDGTWKQIATGLMRPSDSRQIKTNRFTFCLIIPYGTHTTVYLKFKNEASLSFQTSLWDHETYIKKLSISQIRTGGFFGILIIMFGYNLFLSFSLKEISFFYYALCLAGLFLLALSLTGIGYYYFWPNSTGFNLFSVPISNLLMVLAFLQFTISFLQLKHRSRWLYRLMRVQMIFVTGMIIITFFKPYGQVIQPIVFLSGISFISIAISSLLIWIKGFKPARFFAISFFPMVITGLLMAMTRLGFMIKSPLMENSFILSSIVMILLLSLALADRINHLKYQVQQSNYALIESEKRYRNIFNNIQDVYFELSKDGKFVEISPSAKFFFQYNREELLGQPISKILNLNKEEFIKQALNQFNVINFETGFTNHDGKPSFGAIHAVYHESQHNKPGRIIGSLRDISEQKKLENQLMQAQKMEAIGTLSGGIAHDFNNILSAILGNAELGLIRIKEGEPSKNEFTKIFKAAEKATNLTRQLLAFSRKQVIQPKVIDLNSVLKDIHNILRRLIEEDIEIEIECDSNIPGIIADEAQIEQIIINLAVNARDAINENKKNNRIISIKTGYTILDEKYVAKHLGSHIGSHVMLCVNDSGVGIKPEIKNRIFDPFFTTKEKHHGTGLGLSTVFGIVKQNNGSIQVYSEAGQGSTIKIYWPASEQPADIKTEKVLNIDQLYGNETILLVEDDEGVREYAAEILAQFGYNIIVASDGQNALDLMEKKNIKPDILITDVIMPGMRGPELAQQIIKKFPSIKVLYASGYTDNHIVKDGVLEPDVNFIQKPFSARDIANKVYQILHS